MDKELYTLEEVFADAHPGMVVRGLRGKKDITQEELAKRLGHCPNSRFGNRERQTACFAEYGKAPCGNL